MRFEKRNDIFGFALCLNILALREAPEHLRSARKF